MLFDVVEELEWRGSVAHEDVVGQLQLVGEIIVREERFVALIVEVENYFFGDLFPFHFCNDRHLKPNRQLEHILRDKFQDCCFIPHLPINSPIAPFDPYDLSSTLHLLYIIIKIIISVFSLYFCFSHLLYHLYCLTYRHESVLKWMEKLDICNDFLLRDF